MYMHKAKDVIIACMDEHVFSEIMHNILQRMEQFTLTGTHISTS